MFSNVLILLLLCITCSRINADVDYNTIITTQPTSIQDSVSIESTTLIDLDGLNGIGLTYISGELTIRFNSLLTNIDGFSDLTSVGGGINIYDNINLEHINELNELTSIEGLSIYDSDNLESVDGFSSLSLMRGDLYFDNNANLTSIDGLSSLSVIESDLYITRNHLLQNIDGLSNLALIEGGLYIQQNTLLNINALEGVVVLGMIYIPQTLISCSRGVYDTFVSHFYILDCLEIVDAPCADECDKIQFEWVGKSTQMVLRQNCECTGSNREFKIKVESLEEVDPQGKVVKRVPTFANDGFELPEIYEETKYDIQTAKFLLEGSVKVGYSDVDNNRVYSYPDVSIEIWFFQEDTQTFLFGQDIAIEKDSIKWTFNISHWPFESEDNKLRLVMDIHSPNATDDGAEPTSFFPDEANVGEDVVDVDVSIYNHGSHTKVEVDFPYFDSDLSYDPFAYLPLLVEEHVLNDLTGDLIDSSTGVLDDLIDSSTTSLMTLIGSLAIVLI